MSVSYLYTLHLKSISNRNGQQKPQNPTNEQEKHLWGKNMCFNFNYFYSTIKLTCVTILYYFCHARILFLQPKHFIIPLTPPNIKISSTSPCSPLKELKKPNKHLAVLKD